MRAKKPCLAKEDKKRREPGGGGREVYHPLWLSLFKFNYDNIKPLRQACCLREKIVGAPTKNDVL